MVIGGACLLTAVCLMGTPRLHDAGVMAVDSGGIASAAHQPASGIGAGGDLGGGSGG